MSNKDKVYEVLNKDPERILKDGRGKTGFNEWVYKELEGSGIPKLTIKSYIRDYRKENKSVTKSNSKSNRKIKKPERKSSSPKKTVTKSVTDPSLIPVIQRLENEINKLNKSVKELQKDNESLSNSMLQKVKKQRIKPHTIRISRSLLKKCKIEAKDKGLKLYELINLALYEYLENMKITGSETSR